MITIEKINFKVEFYKDVNGDCQVQEFLDSLDTKMKAKMLRMIMLLEEHGSELREPYSKYIKNNIFELRAKQSSNITRILYFFVMNKEIVLTNGFVKKTMKLPQKEIDKAVTYRQDYLKRREQLL